MSTALDKAVKRKATELGVWRPKSSWDNVKATGRLGWHLYDVGSGEGDGTLDVWNRHGPLPYDTHSLSNIDQLTAAVWLMLLEAGYTIERPCPECRGGRAGVVLKHGRLSVTDDACPACVVNGKPTGRVNIGAERVLLDTIPRPSHEARDIVCGQCDRGIDPVGLPDVHCNCDAAAAARADLTVLADALMELGDPTGQVLALRLAGTLREEHTLGASLDPWGVPWFENDHGSAWVTAIQLYTYGSEAVDVEQTDDGDWSVSVHRFVPVLEARPT